MEEAQLGAVLSQTQRRKAREMLPATASPPRLPQWNKNKLHSFAASKEPGAAGHKVLPVAVRQDARRSLH